MITKATDLPSMMMIMIMKKVFKDINPKVTILSSDPIFNISKDDKAITLTTILCCAQHDRW